MFPRSAFPLRRLATAAALVRAAGALHAAVYETQEKALLRLFPPPARVVRSSHFLTPEQVARVQKSADGPLDAALIVRYAGFAPDGRYLGSAYFDKHVVRSAHEVLVIAVSPECALRSVDILAFAEPEDYLPRGGWLKRLAGKSTPDSLYVGRALAHVTGATLTTRAIAAAARRALTIDALLGAPPAPAPEKAEPAK